MEYKKKKQKEKQRKNEILNILLKINKEVQLFF